jgi:hypothetical protein
MFKNNFSEELLNISQNMKITIQKIKRIITCNKNKIDIKKVNNQ